jgi:phospholipid transport system substrate-binding protein
VTRLLVSPRRLAVIALALCWSVTATSAWAGAPTDALRDFFGAVNIVLADPRIEDQPVERLRAIRRHVDEVFDFREAAILALGREWSARTHVEQNEFVALFADLLERSFVWRVAGKASLGGGVKVQYIGETVTGDTATVETAVASRDGNDLKLDYRMVRRADRWVVRDVVMDGVSTMENYHAQFQRIVRDSSWRDLMGQLRAKVGAPPVTVQVAAGPSPGATVTPVAPVVAPFGPSSLDRPAVDDRHVVARDVAAVVTPGLAARDVAPPSHLRQPAPLVAAATTAPASEVGSSRERSAAPRPAIDRSPAVERTPTGERAPVTERAPITTPPVNGVTASRELAAPAPARAGHDSVSAPRSPMAMLAAVSAVAAVTPRPIEPPRVSTLVVARPAAAPIGYWVQVGAFRNATIASRIASHVKGEILVAPPATSGESGEPILRVRVGPFTDRAQAVARMRQLQGLGYQPFLATP